MTRVAKVVLATAAATGLSFGPALACTYMKTAEQKKPMITAKADVQMHGTDAITLKPEAEAEVEAVAQPEDKPAVAE